MICTGVGGGVHVAKVHLRASAPSLMTVVGFAVHRRRLLNGSRQKLLGILRLTTNHRARTCGSFG